MIFYSLCGIGGCNMPFIISRISIPVSREQELELKAWLGKAIELVPGKSEEYLLLGFEDNCRLWLRGDDSEPIAYAVAGKTEAFYESEVKPREMLNFPPFARMLRLVFRAPSEKQAASGANGAAAILYKILAGARANASKLQEAACHTEILGPAECPLSKIAANYRQQIILRGPSVSLLQYMAHTFRENFKAPSEVYIEYDVDPVSLL